MTERELLEAKLAQIKQLVEEAGDQPCLTLQWISALVGANPHYKAR